MENEKVIRLKRFIPPKLRRILKKYISPVVKDYRYYEYIWRKEFFRKAFTALAFNGIDGDYLEFGCCGGITFSLAYHQSRRSGHSCKLWAFDSFSGLPPQAVPQDEHPSWIEGDMAIGINEFKKICMENHIPQSEYTIIPGYYDHSLALPISDELPTNICLAYIDCDLYSSTRTVLEFLMPRLKHGMIIAFDDYYCWSSTQVSGERKACSEFFNNNEQWILLPFVQYGWGGISFVVERRELEGATGFGY